MAATVGIDTILFSDAVMLPGHDRLLPAAVAVTGDTISAVGEYDEVRSWAHDVNMTNGCGAAEVVDCRGAYIYPGFHDAHMHVFHSALYSSSLAANFLGENEQDCVRRMQELAVKRRDGWLLAQGWREYRWDIPRKPTKKSLDAAFSDRPVALYSGDAHTLWLNSVALKELGISADSTPPDGGYYERFEDGELTGIVGETAAMELMPKIVSTFTDAEIADAYVQFLHTLASLGITAVCDMSLMAGAGMDFVRDDIYDRLLEHDELITRISMFPTLQDDLSRFERLYQSERNPLLRACGLKQFFDGVSSQHTAWLNRAYTNARYDGECGRPSVSPDLMRRLVLNANAHGYPVRIHTIGDEAIHVALDIFAESMATYGKLSDGRRNCLEHLENFQPDDIARLGELDVVASVQPAHITLDPGGPERDLGADRVPYMWPLHALLDTSAVLAFGTDSPVVAANPLDNLYAALTRQNASTHEPYGGWLPSEKIDRVQALRAYTEGSAVAAQRACELGSLRHGMRADLVVLDEDLLACDIDGVQKANVLATYVGGRNVYTAL